MFRKSKIIKGLILLLVVGVLVSVGWGIGWKVEEKRKIEEKERITEKRLITKQAAINIANKLGYGSPTYTNLILYNPDPATHYRVYDPEDPKERGKRDIYSYLEIKGKDLWIIKYISKKNETITIVIDAENGKILRVIPKNIEISRSWIDKIFKWFF
jgi:tRNA A37 threonylcarbamoyladenosine biosynthesis protein TsaE